MESRACVKRNIRKDATEGDVAAAFQYIKVLTKIKSNSVVFQSF